LLGLAYRVYSCGSQCPIGLPIQWCFTPKNVLSLYFAFLREDGETAADRKKRETSVRDSFSTMDIANGYLRTKMKEGTSYIEIALFRDAGTGIDYLFRNIVGCGPGCSSSVDIYRCDAKQCVEATKELLPVMPKSIESQGFYYSLPRYGTEIELIESRLDNEKVKLPYKIRFSNGKFVLVKK